MTIYVTMIDMVREAKTLKTILGNRRYEVFYRAH